MDKMNTIICSYCLGTGNDSMPHYEEDGSVKIDPCLACEGLGLIPKFTIEEVKDMVTMAFEDLINDSDKAAIIQAAEGR